MRERGARDEGGMNRELLELLGFGLAIIWIYALWRAFDDEPPPIRTLDDDEPQPPSQTDRLQ